MQHNLHNVRFYGILDTGYATRENWVAKAQALLDGGAGLVQIRAKNVSVPETRKLVEAVWPLFKNGPVPLIINDYVELAPEFPGMGVHIGQDDMSPAEARRLIGPEAILGLSTHAIEQAREAITLAGTIDYFAVGPVFPTQTKPDYDAVGLQLVAQVAALPENPLPWFCIGGINRKNARRVLDLGVNGLVAVSDVLCPEDTASAVREYLTL